MYERLAFATNSLVTLWPRLENKDVIKLFFASLYLLHSIKLVFNALSNQNWYLKCEVLLLLQAFYVSEHLAGRVFDLINQYKVLKIRKIGSFDD